MYYACIVYCENIVPYKTQTNDVKYDVCLDKNTNFSIKIKRSIKYCSTISNK